MAWPFTIAGMLEADDYQEARQQLREAVEALEASSDDVEWVTGHVVPPPFVDQYYGRKEP